ncbi:MAG: HYR domain-containing protein, partial [Chloroflexota bacterium]|nr:HYR domain-containing protein [Chloroflexota bacterium]
MSLTFHSLRRPVSVALVVLASLAPLAPSRVQGQEATPAAEAVAVSQPADTVPPVLEQPGPLSVEAVDATGASVLYNAPLAADAVDGPVLVSCDIPSGAVFPISTALVTCGAQDAAGNAAAVQFSVTVSDTVPPVLEQPGNLLVEAVDASGAAVSYPLPVASDAVSGSVLVSCDIPSGAVFPISTALVTCGAQDAAGNAAAVQFSVTVNPPPPPAPALESKSPAGPTDPPAPTGNTQPPAPTANTQPPALATTPSTGSARDAAVATTPVATSTARVTVTATPTVKEAAVIEVEKAGVLVEEVPSVAPALPLPWPPPGNFVLVTDGGPLGRLALIWANREFPISQEFGHTAFSVSQPFMYRYGIAYGLDGFEHTGLDIGMPAG